MSDRTIVIVARAGVAVGALLAVAGTVVNAAAGNLDYWFDSFAALVTIFTLGFAVFVWLVIARQPRNRAIWAMACSAFGGVFVLANALAPLVADGPADALLPVNYIPAEHPATVAWLSMVAEVSVAAGIFVPLSLGLLLFPDGALPSRRWRPVGWFAALAAVAQSVAYVMALQPDATGIPDNAVPVGVTVPASMLAVVAALVGQFRRFPSSTGATRQQFKLLLWGELVFVCLFFAGIQLGNEDPLWLSPLLGTFSVGMLVVTYGIAVGRYRLYDVDLVISRTIVYASLAAIITAGYISVVVGLGSVVGQADRPDTALAIAATAGVAVAFQPLRQWLQSVADRAIYGKRATPHEVLSEFGRRASADADDLLDQLARSLAEGTGADRVEVWLRDGARPIEAARWPDTSPDGPEERTAIPITADGEDLGSLVLSVGAGQRLSAEDLSLANQVASGAGLALRNRRLTAMLERRVALLRRSRRRLVLVQDATRRRLERDLHDGAQQQLVALRVRLGLARSLAEREGRGDLVATIEHLSETADTVVEDVRAFARGVYPPLLEAEGLRASLAAEVRRSGLPASLELDGIGRYDRDLEATVNLCVVEGLRNAKAHARAEQVTVTVGEEPGVVRFQIIDDGIGFDPATVPVRGRLANLADRIDALAGDFSIVSKPGAGTTLDGTIPLRPTGGDG